jgi:hypothetical protein
VSAQKLHERISALNSSKFGPVMGFIGAAGHKEALSNLASPFDLAQTKPAAAAGCAALFQFACRALEICRKTARQFVII